MLCAQRSAWPERGSLGRGWSRRRRQFQLTQSARGSIFGANVRKSGSQRRKLAAGKKIGPKTRGRSAEQKNFLYRQLLEAKERMHHVYAATIYCWVRFGSWRNLLLHAKTQVDYFFTNDRNRLGN